MDTSSLRASDADRERIAEVLREHGADGRLSIDEVTKRLGATYDATTRAELDRLVADLPTPAPPALDTATPWFGLVAALSCPLMIVLLLIVALIR